MSANIFQEYYEPLSRVIEKDQGYERELTSYHGYQQLFYSKKTSKKAFQEGSTPTTFEGPKHLAKLNFKKLEELFGPNPHSLSEITLGPHPDFKDVEHDSSLNHHCVSVFADIKGSTNLINKYSLNEIRFIKDSVLTLCIYISHFFGGHIHRLQGDGIFLQFVRRDNQPNDAIINALNASSLIVFFLQSILSKAFENQGIDPLKVRIGIDYGGDDSVLWSHYGIPGCSELTTTSLHTDLAAKLQANAPSNGIMIGKNVALKLDLADNFWGYITKPGSDEKDYYIFRGDDINYNQYQFDWEKYLLTFDFFQKDYDENKLYIEIPNLRLKCKISEGNTFNRVYHQNLYSIPKEFQLKYEIYNANFDRRLSEYEFENIRWEAHNTGTEAEEAEQLKHCFGHHYDGKIYCETSAKYLGHHQAVCKLSQGRHSKTVTLSFPIFVQ